MSAYPFFLRWMALPFTTLLGVALAATAPQVLGGEAARLDGFSQADGANVFALTLKPSANREPQAGVPAAAAPRDVVILVSTAASQTGDYRAKSLAALQAALGKLNAGDRVKLVAFDLEATPLTRDFGAPDSPQMAAALKALKQRTPLGACDIENALETAAKSFAVGKARAVVYIGDGSSRANVLTPDRFDRLANELVARRAPVVALGVGPQIDEQLLGALASRTGGVVMPEQAEVGADVYGARLAQAVHGKVFWPTAAGSVNWPAGLDVYPKIFPPLRSDRDTVLVGTAKAMAAGRVEIDVAGPAGAQKMVFDIPALKSEADNGYLVTLVDQAKVDGGRTLPLVDSASLATAKQEIEAGGRGLNDLAFKALHAGNLEQADILAGQALSRNPSDLVARAIKNDVARQTKAAPVGSPARSTKGTPSAPVVGQPGDLNLQGSDVGLPAPDGSVAMQEISRSAALEQQWQKDVDNTINQARNQVALKPDAAKAMLVNETNDLRAVNELSPEMRASLLGKLHAASREIQRRSDEVIAREQQRIQQEMSQREMQEANQALQRDQDKVDQLMKRFEVLLADARRNLSDHAAQDAVTALDGARQIAQGSLPNAQPTMVAATHLARFQTALDDSMALRVAGQKGFVDNLYQTERSHVAQPDDPPIVYPEAEAWRELSARRKEKYSSQELSKASPAEKKIAEALKQPTQIEFVDTPLKDVIDYLKDMHHVEIQLDGAAMKELGVEESTPITKNLKGISLRSALKLLLDELGLKYVVHNEVILITSPAKTETDEFLTGKVYPVADLVLPIKETGFKGGFGGMGVNNTMGGNQMNSQSMGQGNPFSGGQNGNPFGGLNQGNPFGGNQNGNLFGGNQQFGGGNGNPFGRGM